MWILKIQLKADQGEGKISYALEPYSAKFSFAPFLISSLGDNFHCASTLLTAQRRKAQTHSHTADSPKQ